MSVGPHCSVAANPSERKFSESLSRQGKHHHPIVRRAIICLDQALRRALGIFEFSENQYCLLRIAVVRARTNPTPPNGMHVHRDDFVVDLHFWNEHVERLLAGRAACARAKSICRYLRFSLQLLAEYISAHPEMNVRLMHARIVMPIGDRFGKFKALAETYGFVVTTSPARGAVRIHDFLEAFLVRALAWVFNPNRPTKRRLRLCRADLWISRDRLLDRYLRSGTSDIMSHSLTEKLGTPQKSNAGHVQLQSLRERVRKFPERKGLSPRVPNSGC
jgi:hypothetical protein